MKKPMKDETESGTDEWRAWDRARATMMNQWVVAVLVFWISVGGQVALYLYSGELNLLLLSVALGMLVLGVALKTRMQLHLRRAPKRLP